MQVCRQKPSGAFHSLQTKPSRVTVTADDLRKWKSSEKNKRDYRFLLITAKDLDLIIRKDGQFICKGGAARDKNGNITEFSTIPLNFIKNILRRQYLNEVKDGLRGAALSRYLEWFVEGLVYPVIHGDFGDEVSLDTIIDSMESDPNW